MTPTYRHGGARPGAGRHPADIDINRLRHLVEAVRLTQAEVAARLGVSQATVSRHLKKLKQCTS